MKSLFFILAVSFVVCFCLISVDVCMKSTEPRVLFWCYLRHILGLSQNRHQAVCFCRKHRLRARAAERAEFVVSAQGFYYRSEVREGGKYKGARLSQAKSRGAQCPCLYLFILFSENIVTRDAVR
jgi:hypothetical protein